MMAVFAGGVAVPILGGSPFPAVAIGDLLSIGTVGVVIILTLGVIVAAFTLTSRSPLADSDATTNADSETNEDSGSREQRRAEDIDQGTLDRLQRLSPDAVRRVREQQSRNEPVESIEKTLYRGIEDAIADGKLDLSIRSRYGEKYEIVNLPSRLRETELPMMGERIYVQEIEKGVREWIDDEETPIHEIAYAIEAILDHRNDLERYVQNHEEAFGELYSDIESDIESIRSITGELDRTVGERTRMLVVEDRHDGFDGVGGLKTRVSEAKSKLHHCAFADATGQLRTIRSDADKLLTAVDFIRSLIGGIEHGQQSARLPTPTAEQLYTELEPLLEQQYGVTLSLEDGRVVIERDETQTSSSPETGTTLNRDDRPTYDTVEPGEATDEILYTLRELKQSPTTENAIQYQTEQLPDGIATRGLLEALAAFCRRQTDIVTEVTLQEDAPSGFLEIQFTETTEATAGIDELIDRFIARYGAAD